MEETKKDKQDTAHNEEEELASMSLGDHLDELRYRLVRAVGGLILGVVVSLFFGKYFFDLLMFPYNWAMTNAGLKPQMLALKPMEQFIIYLKICMVAGLVFSSFWVFYQLWAFVSAGLYRHERRMVKLAAPASASLFVFGAVFFLLVVARYMMQFCVSFNVGVQYVQPGVYQLSDYVNLILLLALIFGLAFQMPIAIVFAERMGLITIAAVVHLSEVCDSGDRGCGGLSDAVAGYRFTTGPGDSAVPAVRNQHHRLRRDSQTRRPEKDGRGRRQVMITRRFCP